MVDVMAVLAINTAIQRGVPVMLDGKRLEMVVLDGIGVFDDNSQRALTPEEIAGLGLIASAGARKKAGQ